MKKKQLDVGKGFKRIFYVAATIWFILIMVATAAQRSECIPADGWVTPPFCDNSSDIGAFFYSFIIWLISTFAVYYFVKWIAAGFNKK